MILDNPSDNVIMTTKNGITKRTNLEELIVSRYTKPINAMKLKDGDEVVSVVKDNGRAIFVTETGYYLNIDSNEIPLVGAKASGVKGINVKDDIPPSIWLGTTYSVNVGYTGKLVEDITCADNLDDNPKCEIVGKYDTTEAGEYKLTFKAKITGISQ